MRCVASDCRFFFQTYDPPGRLKTLTYPDSEVVSYTYDTLGKLSSLPGIVNSITWTARSQDRARQFSSISYANGVLGTYSRSPERGWLNAVSVEAGGNPLYQASYGYYGDGTSGRSRPPRTHGSTTRRRTTRCSA